LLSAAILNCRAEHDIFESKQATTEESTTFALQTMTGAYTNKRRSVRVLFPVRIVVSGTNPQTGVSFRALGTTLVVNKHGALIQTVEGLPEGMGISVTVPSRNQSARARIVWTDGTVEGKYGID
jgi:hypothetical protein